jgi:hypothetical protein
MKAKAGRKAYLIFCVKRRARHHICMGANVYYMHYIEEKHKLGTLKRLFVSAFLEGEAEILKEPLSKTGDDSINILITISSLTLSSITFFFSICVKFIMEKQFAFFELKTKNVPI